MRGLVLSQRKECQACCWIILSLCKSRVLVVTRQQVFVLSAMFCVVCSSVVFAFRRMDSQVGEAWGKIK